jgi:hypothetical protein
MEGGGWGVKSSVLAEEDLGGVGKGKGASVAV